VFLNAVGDPIKNKVYVVVSRAISTCIEEKNMECLENQNISKKLTDF